MPNYIMTSVDYGLTIYDRKSPRHNWNILINANLVQPESVDHAKRVAALWRKRVRAEEGWEQYEQIAVWQKYDDGKIPDNLPRNFDFSGYEQEEL